MQKSLIKGWFILIRFQSFLIWIGKSLSNWTSIFCYHHPSLLSVSFSFSPIFWNRSILWFPCVSLTRWNATCCRLFHSSMDHNSHTHSNFSGFLYRQRSTELLMMADGYHVLVSMCVVFVVFSSIIFIINNLFSLFPSSSLQHRPSGSLPFHHLCFYF